MEFAVRHDDGQSTHGLVDADIVLIGVSRTGKTPLSMYLGYLGYKTANVPLVAGSRLLSRSSPSTGGRSSP